MTLIENALQERHAVRMLLKTAGFTIAAVITLGLGVGANTAIFSLVKAVLIEPLPYRTPDHLVLIWNPVDARGTTHLSVREIVSYGDLAKSFEQIAAYTETNANLTGEEDPERVRAGVVTANLFDTLGVAPMLGRTFTAADGDPGASEVVMLSEGLWQRRLGRAADVIGRSLRVRVRWVWRWWAGSSPCAPCSTADHGSRAHPAADSAWRCRHRSPDCMCERREPAARTSGRSPA